MKTYFTEFPSPLGPLQLRGTATTIRALYMAENRHSPPLPHDAHQDKSPLRQAQEQVEEFLAGQRLYFSLPLEMLGTPFQLRVWRELLAIPYAKTASYGEIAQKLALQALDAPWARLMDETPSRLLCRATASSGLAALSADTMVA